MTLRARQPPPQRSIDDEPGAAATAGSRPAQVVLDIKNRRGARHNSPSPVMLGHPHLLDLPGVYTTVHDAGVSDYALLPDVRRQGVQATPREIVRSKPNPVEEEDPQFPLGEDLQLGHGYTDAQQAPSHIGHFETRLAVQPSFPPQVTWNFWDHPRQGVFLCPLKLLEAPAATKNA